MLSRARAPLAAAAAAAAAPGGRKMMIAQLLRSYATASGVNEVLIVSAARTPVGCFAGALSKVPAVELGAVAIRGAITKARLKPDQIEEVYMGNVLQANLGQAPARQAALDAGCPESTEATTVNKVCSSGLKAVIMAAQNLQLGIRSVMVAGGMESMSMTPYYVERNLRYGHQQMTDSVVKDGLTDAFDRIHMGACAEETATKYKIGRQAQDAHAIESYKRAAAAWKAGLFKEEVVPVKIKGRKNEVVVTEDEEYKNVNFEKVPQLKPVFQQQNGTITAANASTLNDGASALVLATRAKADQLKLVPLAQIISYADAACAPKLYTIAPSLAVPIALERAGLTKDDISLFEFNEAFSVVARVNEQLLGLDSKKVNVAGGAVALGHPIGSSGSRILVTLTHLLKPGQYGCAAICNGGGGASSVVIKRL